MSNLPFSMMMIACEDPTMTTKETEMTIAKYFASVKASLYD